MITYGRNKRSYNKNKPTFQRFLKNVHGMLMADYFALDNLTQMSIEVDYKDRYGRITRWFEEGVLEDEQQ